MNQIGLPDRFILNQRLGEDVRAEQAALVKF
jgi:hypothetical protein